MNQSILFIEDDHNLGYILSEYLDMHHFAVTWAKDGKEALNLLNKHNYDLCIIDVMLPHVDGFALADQMKKELAQTPFIFLTAKSLKIDKLKGFKLGADDYITKPVDEEELIARIQAVLKRGNAKQLSSGFIPIGNTMYNSNAQRIIFKGSEITLTNKEAEVLFYLASNKNKITQRDEVLKKVWGSNDFFNRRSMDVIISRLRKHLQPDETIIIKNIHGKGYILEEVWFDETTKQKNATC